MINEKNPDENTAEATEETVLQETENAPASLTVQDLANLRNIIDIASQRGAFRANEFTVVGAIYTKLSSFIETVAPAPEGAPAQKEGAPVEVPGE